MATSAGRPTSTRVARATALVGTLGVLVLVFDRFPDTFVPAVVGGVGATGLVGAVRLADGTDRPLSAVGAGLLVVPSGASLLGSISIVALLLVESVFPVEEEALLSVGWLLVAGHVAIVVGCSIAVLGFAVTLRPAVDSDSLRRSMRVVLATGTLPVVAAGAFLVSAVTSDTTPDTTLVPPVTAFVEAFVAPASSGLHLWSLLVVLALAAAGARVVLSPEADGDESDLPLPVESGSLTASSDRWQSRLSHMAVASGGLAAVALAVETVVSPDRLATIAPGYSAVRAVTTVPHLRMGLLVVAAPLLALALQGLRARMTTAGLPVPSARTAGGLLGGVLTTVVVVAFARRAYAGAVAELVDRFPAGVESDVRNVSDSLAGSFGESTVVLLGVVLCLAVTAWALLLLYFVLRAGLLSGESPGHSLTSVGLFVAVLFSGTLGAPAWFVVTGVAVSLLVWDAGRFGATITREVGAGSTHTVEFVHLGAAVVVGLVGVATALLVVTRLPAGGIGPSPTELLALCSVVVGILSLVFALR